MVNVTFLQSKILHNFIIKYIHCKGILDREVPFNFLMLFPGLIVYGLSTCLTFPVHIFFANRFLVSAATAQYMKEYGHKV